jgi:hypothetical protein
MKKSRHGRNAGYPAPPVQSRTCSFPASGSSVALASAQGRTVVSSGPQGGWLMLIRSDMSGLRVLSGLRASVETFPVSWAFPTAEYDARYDAPDAYDGLPLSPDSSACLPPWSTRVRRFQHGSVSGCPLPCLRSCRPYTNVFHGQERRGPPTFFDASLPSGRSAARMTLGREFPPPALSICEAGASFSHSPRFRKPPSHPGRSAFPSPGGSQ